MQIQENVPLKTLTTFRTGGPARFLILLDTPEEIPEAVQFAKENGVPLIPLGSGSNMLAPDIGVPAAFVRLLSSTISATENNGVVFLTADAGVLWDELVAYTVERGLWGVENLSAIPGTAGAAVVQNIGAYGAAISDVLHEVSAYDLAEGTKKIFTNEDAGFGYRTSIFKRETDRYFITKVTITLSKNPRPNLAYRDLALRFAEEKDPSIADIRDAVVEIRKGKFPPLSSFGTAGSFFLNPIVTEKDSEEIKKRFPDMPLFSLPEGGIKVPLAWILDKVLHLKGGRMGKAFLWEQQPLVVTADAAATSAEVMALAESVAHDVHQKTGISIVPEVRLLK